MIVRILILLFMCSGVSAQIQLTQLQRGTANMQIPVTNGPLFSQRYENLLTLIQDSLQVGVGVDSIYIQNDTIFLRDGSGWVSLIPYINTDNQQISLSNDTIFLENGGFIVLPIPSVLPDSIYLSNDTIFLRDGSGFVDLGSLVISTDGIWEYTGPDSIIVNKRLGLVKVDSMVFAPSYVRNDSVLVNQMYVLSRNDNYITGGYLYSDRFDKFKTYNFPLFEIDTTDHDKGLAAYVYKGMDYDTITTFEMIMLDELQTYRFSLRIKGDGINEYYAGVICFDRDSKIIDHKHVEYRDSTETFTLTSITDVSEWVRIDDPSNWSEGPGFIAFYEYESTTGFMYPDYTYTRRVVPFSSRVGDTIYFDGDPLLGNISDGISVSEALDGDLFIYAVKDSIGSDQWEYHDTVFGPRIFTAYVKPVFQLKENMKINSARVFAYAGNFKETITDINYYISMGDTIGLFYINENKDTTVMLYEECIAYLIPGPPGEQGIQGIQGIQGETGDVGPRGFSVDSVYIVGDSLFLRTEDEIIWGGFYVRGEQGEIGPQGPEGPTGPPGDTGPAGPTGIGIADIYSSNDSIYVELDDMTVFGGFAMPIAGLDSIYLENDTIRLRDGSGFVDVSGFGGDTSKWEISGANIFNKNSGNVGVGFTSPSQKLDVNGNARAERFLPWGTTASGTGMYFPGGNSLGLTQAGTERLRITSTGIGYNHNAAAINHYSLDKEKRWQIMTDTNTTAALSFFSMFGDDQIAPARAGELAFFGKYIIFQANKSDGGFGTEVMRITSDLQVGIGTNGPTEKLDVDGNARFRSVGSETHTNDLRITSTGVLTTHTSDIRMKENIFPLYYNLDRVMKIKPVSFTWKNDENEKTEIGFIAQEMETVVPEVVFTNQTTGMMGINYSNLTPILAGAIQEQNRKILILEAYVEQLILKIGEMDLEIKRLKNE